MPRGRSARATRTSRLPEIFEMDGHLLESYNHIDDLPRLSDEPKKRPRHVTRGSVAAERKAAAAAVRTSPVPTTSPRPMRRSRVAAAVAAAAAAAAADAAATASRANTNHVVNPSRVAADKKRAQQRKSAQLSKVCCRVCLRSYSATKIIRCLVCRKGVHTFCLNPPLIDLPSFGSWKCQKCKRRAITLKREKRSILRDALVTYPSLCTNSLVEKIIDAAASIDAAAIKSKLTFPLTSNDVDVTETQAETPANDCASTATVIPVTDLDPNDLNQQSYFTTPDQTVQAVIPLSRAGHSRDPLTASSIPLSNINSVIIRVPKKLLLEEIELPIHPRESPGYSKGSRHAVSDHQTGLKRAKRAGAPHRSQVPPVPKKRKLHPNVDGNAVPQALTNGAKSWETESLKQPPLSKRSQSQAHQSAELLPGSSAFAQSSTRSSQCPVKRPPPSGSDGTDSKPCLPPLQRNRLPLQKRYKYDVAQSVMGSAGQSPRKEKQASDELLSSPAQPKTAGVFPIPRLDEVRSTIVAPLEKSTASDDERTPWLIPQCSSNVQVSKTGSSILSSQTQRMTRNQRGFVAQERKPNSSHSVSLSGKDSKIARAEISREKKSSKHVPLVLSFQRHAGPYAKAYFNCPQSLAPVTKLVSPAMPNLVKVELDGNNVLGEHDEDSHHVDEVAPKSDDDINLAGLAGSALSLRTGHNNAAQPDRAKFPRTPVPAWKERTKTSDSANPAHMPASQDRRVLFGNSPLLNVDLGHTGVLSSSDNNGEESSSLAVRPGPESAKTSEPLISKMKLKVNGDNPISWTGPCAGLQGFSTKCPQKFIKPTSGDFFAPHCDGGFWDYTRTMDPAPGTVSSKKTVCKHASNAAAMVRDTELDPRNPPQERGTLVGHSSLTELPRLRSEKLESKACGQATQTVKTVKKIPETTGENIVSSKLGTVSSRYSTEPQDIANIQKAVNQSATPQNNSGNQTNAASICVKDLQWEAKREALMAFAQVQRQLAVSQGRRKLQTGNPSGEVNTLRQDSSQVERNISRNKNVPETERHRMEVTALATSSRYRSSKHELGAVRTVKKGSISSLLHSSSELPPSGRRTFNSNEHINRSDRTPLHQFPWSTNYDSGSNFELLRMSADARSTDRHGGESQKRGISTSQQPIYDRRQDYMYRPNTASLELHDRHLPGTSPVLPQQKAHLTPYLLEGRMNQVYESRSANEHVQQRPLGSDSFSQRARQRSSVRYGMRDQHIQCLTLNPMDESKKSSQGRAEPPLPSASNLHSHQPEHCAPNNCRVFRDVPNHVRLAPVSFLSNRDKTGSSKTAAPVLEPMEMPPFGRPGDPIRYNDPPPLQYRKAATPSPIPHDRPRLASDPNQNMKRVYMSTKVSNAEGVSGHLDQRQIAQTRQTFAQNDYATPTASGNEVRASDCAIGFLNVDPSKERTMMMNAPCMENLPRRHAKSYEESETRRTQYEQKKALAFVGVSQERHGLNTGLFDLSLRPEESMLNRTPSLQMQHTPNFSNLPEPGDAFRGPRLKETLPGLDYSDDYHVRPSGTQRSGSIRNNDALGSTIDKVSRLGALPDAGMSLSKQIRALVSSNTRKASATSEAPNQCDRRQSDEVSHALPTDISMPQSDSMRQPLAPTASVVTPPASTGPLSKDSSVAATTQEDVQGAVATDTVAGE
ncbi:unnamed protein product [Agarophyton chilense]|eukprot:gb/GEZJ01000195.1/.p1 GENE.gb/GEZJ01000195.1/~~gb/GEZJ01000195.1/.p1  ORF type:complete len:1664 (-),score=215.36 gb/GEZJ01000195.1/:541-5532(-)